MKRGMLDQMFSIRLMSGLLAGHNMTSMTALLIAWRKESQARIRRLVASVLGRLQAIVDAQGGHVNYQYILRKLF